MPTNWPKQWIVLGLTAGALMLSVAAGPLFAAAKDAGAADEAAPDLSGLWARTGEPMFEPIPGATEGKPVARLEVNSKDAEEIMAGNWDNPILQPWARDIVKKNADSEVALKHVYQADDSCWPVTVPAILNMREAVQFLQSKDRITILYQRDHQIRRVWLNRKHSTKVTPSWYGESVGHYEGDTLVVDTIGVKAHAMSFVDPFGTPHTDKLHIVERYRPIKDDKGKGVAVQIRVEDPGTFTGPWVGQLTYRPNRAPALEEVICEENNVTFDGQTFGPLPEEKHPQF
ncbi:MAG TPA: hypothetical protein VNH44_06800 [Micropepsaceae bacterium]|nr:hypothetical protein [Micropepsaceae bacterium]